MTVLDLFCGAVGGWSLGLHRAGFRTVAAAEVDPWRRRIFAHNNPNAEMFDDVRAVGADELVRRCGRLPDVVVGSPPCQDASAANTRGRGVDGERTGLFFEAIRIVDECRPVWCAFENSPRLRTRGYDRIAAALEAIGYAPEAIVVGARDVGAPHLRQRVWIVAPDASRIGCEPWIGAAGRESGARPPRCASADANRDGIRVQPGRGERADRDGAAEPAHAPDPDDQRQGRAPAAIDRGGFDAGQPAADAGDPDGAGLALWEGLGDDARAQFAALERAVGPAVHTWHGGAARHLRVAHGAAARLAGIRVPDHERPGRTINAARACIAAQGDAILPQIAEAIGRSMRHVTEHAA